MLASARFADRGYGTPASISGRGGLVQAGQRRLKPTAVLRHGIVGLRSRPARRLIDEAGFRARLAYERSSNIESMILYELRGR